jgi:hypothetical protein
MNDDAPPDPELAERLRAEPVPAPSAEARDRMRTRLASVIPALAAPGAASAADGGAPAKVSALGAHGLTVVGVAFVVGVVAGGGAMTLTRREPPPRVVYVDRPLPLQSAPSIVAPAPSASAIPSAVRPPRSVPSASPTPRPDVLAEERQVIDDARRRLTAGNAADALDVLDAHARRFPHGQLAEEREALAVQALVLRGRYDDARARADALRAHAPNSVYLPAVDVALRSIP